MTFFHPHWARYNNPVDAAYNGARVFVWSLFAGGELADVEFEGSPVRYQIPVSAIEEAK